MVCKSPLRRPRLNDKPVRRRKECSGRSGCEDRKGACIRSEENGSRRSSDESWRGEICEKWGEIGGERKRLADGMGGSPLNGGTEGARGSGKVVDVGSMPGGGCRGRVGSTGVCYGGRRKVSEDGRHGAEIEKGDGECDRLMSSGNIEHFVDGDEWLTA